MDGRSLLVYLVDALAWPIVALLIVAALMFFFRKQIAELISRITRISHNGTSIDLRPLRDLQDETVETMAIDARTNDAIERDPRAAVIEAWLRVELAATDILKQSDVPVQPRSPMQAIRALNDRGLLFGNLYEMLTELRNVRNAAAHELDAPIDSDVARNYVELSEYVMAVLRANAEG